MAEEQKKNTAAVTSSVATAEEKILKFWQDNNIFEKSLTQTKKGEPFVFYDGPPFATGLPHYGHLLASVIKDVIPRYQTMRGRYVPRRWGWDCHGLPIENLIEKELGLATKKDIETYGIGKFNQVARDNIFRFADEWKKQIARFGRWIDMDNPYLTMDSTYTDSVWWSFSKLYKKDLAYKGFKSMHICPRCETTLSNFEVTQGYKDVKDISVYVKFELVDEPGTYLLAWTTTPWTLPGNVALAVGKKIEYQVLHIKETGEKVIIAKDRVEKVLKDKGYELVREIAGKELVGKSYKPLFGYYSKNKSLPNYKNGWKVYAADFVTTEDGTGIVHIAPAFGEDDLNLANEEKLPIVQHVGADGIMKSEVTDFAGMSVKPKSDDEKTRLGTDIAVIKYLQDKNLFFAKENLVHPYPHCWRCDTPLLNYAAESWFVKVEAIKKKLLKENQKIGWVPEHIKDGRFGKWLEGARDWAVSRQRYWGAPLPVWVCNKCEKIKVIGSAEEIKKEPKNQYWVMRHGQAENNTKEILWSLEFDEKEPSHLTEIGRDEAQKAIRVVKKIKPDLIFISPLTRTKETAEVLKTELGWQDSQIIVDERIKEMGMGEWNGKDIKEFYKNCRYEERFEKGAKGGETYADTKKRMGGFLYDLETKYQGKKILIISHETPIFLLIASAAGWNRQKALDERGGKDFIGNAEVRPVEFSILPHNGEYELDLHRPFIDEVKLICSCGGEMTRIKDVFDTWYDSGSMPFATRHFLGEKKLPAQFPADFIAEGADQTRGWFYTLLVLSTALFGKSPYKNVIVNGIILAEDGQKMSKRLKNYPDPTEVINKYGADALRFYLLSSPAVRAETLNFSEKGVDEVMKKIVLRLKNIASFLEMYTGNIEASNLDAAKSSNLLDQWIVARLEETSTAVTAGLNALELDRAARPFYDFVEDFSTWYVRRSRERFKSDDIVDKKAALATMIFVVSKFSKLLAPFAPFLAEELYQAVKTGDEKESVHLETWPTAGQSNIKILSAMAEARRLVSVALEQRAAAGIKVRQPLLQLTVEKGAVTLTPEYLKIIAEEVNVKKVVLGDETKLDTTLTPELEKEGAFRDLVRFVQDLRKKKGLRPGEPAKLTLATDEAGKQLVETFRAELLKSCSLGDIEIVENVSGEELKTAIGDFVATLITND